MVAAVGSYDFNRFIAALLRGDAEKFTARRILSQADYGSTLSRGFGRFLISCRQNNQTVPAPSFY